MDLIDSEGRLFGFLNVIDAVVILLVVAVGVAGIALVVGGSGTDSDQSDTDSVDVGTTHVTLDFGVQNDAIAEVFDEGVTYSPSGRSTLTVTDVYLAPGTDGTHVLARAKLQGKTTEAGRVSIAYDGAPPRLGRSLTVTTDRYSISGTIRAVGGGPSLDTGTTPAVLQATVSPETARSLVAGTQYSVAGRPVASVEDVSVYETDSAGERLVVVLAEVSTYRIDGRQYFGRSVLSPGISLTLPVANGTISSEVERLGTDVTLGRETNEVLVTATMSADEAQAVTVGDTYTVAGRAIGTVETVSVYGTNDPERKRVYAGLTLQTVSRGDTPYFGATRLREGATVPFRTDEYEFSGEIVRLGSTEPRGSPATRTVTLQMQDLSPARAGAIREGMTERAGGDTVARLLDVEGEPSQVLVTSDSGEVFLRDHPTQQDLTITANLTVRETSDTTLFKGEPIRPGSTVTLDLGTVTIRAEVLSL